MYEPRILQKKKPNSIANTPAGKFYGTLNILLATISFAGVIMLSRFLLSKRKIIDELDGNCIVSQEVTSHDQFIESRDFWVTQPHLSGVMEEVIKRQAIAESEQKPDENSKNL